MAIIKGNDLNNTLNGTTGNDTINGMGGNDSLIGNLGDDFYDFSGVFGDDAVTELSVGGSDTLRILSDIPASAIRLVGDAFDDLYVVADGFGSIRLVDHLLGAKVESLKIGSAAPISLTQGLNITGNINNNSLYGTAFNDTFNGKGGSDSMRGRLGNDTYIIDNAGISIVENLNEGTDTVKSSLNFTLPLNVENLTLAGGSPINGSGNDLNNKLTGNSAANQLISGLGNDTLDGKAGADNMIGGLGNDNYIVDNTGDVVTENLNQGIDKISSSITRTLPTQVENLTLIGTSAINGTGNGLSNILIGNSAANQLNGAGGNDTLDGGLGNNTLTGGTGQDTFKFTSVGHVDAINDFVLADDTIQLENTVFTALTTTGPLTAGLFRIGNAAIDTNDFVIYNNITGTLLYDADANGAGLAIQIATIGVGLAITNADFVVI
ncbi:MAG: calcium-binding protein [Nitrosomonas sp.]|nr:calcium-binding protein [Nitrosomonas sp.]